MIVLGIDPGYAIVGYGVIRVQNSRYHPLEYGAIVTKAEESFNRRLEIIYDAASAVMQKWKPDAISMEKLYFQNNQKTAIGVAQARGVLLLAAQKAGIQVYEYTPLQVKQAVTGYGKADKRQVQQMVKLLLNLPEIPRPDDAADGLAIAITHAHSIRMRQNYRI